MGTIKIIGMEFYAYHGCFLEEQVVGNHFLVDIEMEADCTLPRQTDNIKDAVNYQTAYELVKKEMQQKSHLLENVAGRILDSLFKNLPNIKKVSVRVAKQNPPMGGSIKETSVTLTKKIENK